MKRMKDHKAAEREALEKAAVVGRIGNEPAATYEYWKRGDTAFHLYKVTVYPLNFERQLLDWREKGQRDARWLCIVEAAALIEDPSL